MLCLILLIMLNYIVFFVCIFRLGGAVSLLYRSTLTNLCKAEIMSHVCVIFVWSHGCSQRITIFDFGSTNNGHKSHTKEYFCFTATTKKTSLMKKCVFVMICRR